MSLDSYRAANQCKGRPRKYCQFSRAYCRLIVSFPALIVFWLDHLDVHVTFGQRYCSMVFGQGGSLNTAVLNNPWRIFLEDLLSLMSTEMLFFFLYSRIASQICKLRLSTSLKLAILMQILCKTSLVVLLNAMKSKLWIIDLLLLRCTDDTFNINNFVLSYFRVKDMAADRHKKLDESNALHQFYRDLDDEESWIK